MEEHGLVNTRTCAWADNRLDGDTRDCGGPVGEFFGVGDPANGLPAGWYCDAHADAMESHMRWLSSRDVRLVTLDLDRENMTDTSKTERE